MVKEQLENKKLSVDDALDLAARIKKYGGDATELIKLASEKATGEEILTQLTKYLGKDDEIKKVLVDKWELQITTPGPATENDHGSHDTTTAISNPDGKLSFSPIVKNNGKIVYFFYGYQNTPIDQIMKAGERLSINDDILRLRMKGYTVIVNSSATFSNFEKAVYDKNTAGIVWSGHGAPPNIPGVSAGDVEASDRTFFNPGMIDKTKVGNNLKFVVFETCNTGLQKDAWKNVLNTEVIGWDRPTTVPETNDFNTPDSWLRNLFLGNRTELDDLIEKLEQK